MEFSELIIQHIYMVLVSVGFAMLFAIPLAIFVYKKNFHIELVLDVITILQSFPVIGLFAILVTFLGIGMGVAIFAMFLYALMPIFVNTIQGFKSINPEYYEIIRSLQISKRDVLLKIELPLVIPFIISGIRITTIYTISLVTVATFIGAGGLGDLIYLGLQQMDLKITLIGVIPILIMTIVANKFFNYLEHVYLPEDQRNKKV